MNITPLFDRVLALPQKESSITKSGIMTSINDESRRLTKLAEVIKTGSGEYDSGVFIEMQVKPGDKIFYEEHTTSKIYYKNIEYILIKQTDILAKIQED